ncbi:MAG: anti-sigma regulatory factor [Lyngbya sp.]|nr:anti-sigma regulatory factor [Lyngbya sp.]
MEPLVVPGTLEYLDKIAQYVLCASKRANLGKKASKLRLAVDEIATNIILHGYQNGNQEGTIKIRANIDEHTLTIYLEDTGTPFDPTAHQHPENLDKPLEERALGGLGIYLARENVDEFLYQRIHHTNRNIFVMNRPQ